MPEPSKPLPRNGPSNHVVGMRCQIRSAPARKRAQARAEGIASCRRWPPQPAPSTSATSGSAPRPASAAPAGARAAGAPASAVEALLRAALDAAFDGFALLTAVRAGGRLVDFDVSYVNEVGAKLGGKAVSEMVGARLTDAWPPAVGAELLHRYAAV